MQEAGAIWALSDVHVDYAANLELLRELPACYASDVLLLAGDVTHRLPLLRTTLEVLLSKFLAVYFVPGNHDLWVHQEAHGRKDSLAKMHAVHRMCAELGVRTAPSLLRVAGRPVLVVPLISWYDEDFDAHQERDSEADIATGDGHLEYWMDHMCCRWPSLFPKVYASQADGPGYEETGDGPEKMRRGVDPVEQADSVQLVDMPLAEHLARNRLIDEVLAGMNDERLALAEAQRSAHGEELAVVSLSHFAAHPLTMLPRADLAFKGLAKVAGSTLLAEQVRQLAPSVHVYGHTHINVTHVLDGTIHLQNALKYPRQRKRKAFGMRQVWPPTEA